VLDWLQGVRRSGSGDDARCANQYGQPSLTISPGTDGRILLHCHAGCKPEEACGAIGLRLADLFPSDSDASSAKASLRCRTPRVPRGEWGPQG